MDTLVSNQYVLNIIESFPIHGTEIQLSEVRCDDEPMGWCVGTNKDPAKILAVVVNFEHAKSVYLGATEMAKFMGWRLWLDDLRNPKHHATDYSTMRYVWCVNVEQAIYYTELYGPPAYMALDHDLGMTEQGREIKSTRYLKWLESKYPDSCPDYHVHSANPVGVENIHSFMKSWRKSLKQ